MQKKNDEMRGTCPERHNHTTHPAGLESPPHIEQARGRRSTSAESSVERIERGGSQVSCAAVFRSALSQPVFAFFEGCVRAAGRLRCPTG